MASADVVARGPRRRRRRPGRHDHTLIPLKSRPHHLRLDVLPFALLYLLLIAWDARLRGLEDDAGEQKQDDNDLDGEYLALNLCFLAALLCHLGLFLATRWKVGVRASVGYVRVVSPTTATTNVSINNKQTAAAAASTAAESMRSWTHVLVTPLGHNNAGSMADVVPIALHVNEGGETVAVADFHSTVFRCTSSSSGVGRDDEMDGIWGSSAAADSTTPSTSSTAVDSSSSSGSGSEANNFHRLHFPIDLPLPFYAASWSGHATPTSLHRTRTVYGPNALPIALPPFLSLLADQLVAPFFLFQLFCVLLWCLDEYWYYAIFTLFTLVMFESTVAYNRLKSLQRLRETLKKPFRCWVYRERQWGVIRTDELVAGDVMSLSPSDGAGPSGQGLNSGGAGNQRHHDHEGGRHVPADCLLLSGGTAVVDEAALTGESVPQMKEPVDSILGALDTGGSDTTDGAEDNANEDIRLDVDDPLHRKSVLFGGTKLVNHCPAPPLDDEDADSNGGDNGGTGTASIPPPPDSGLAVLILRTGFDTSQGSLLRTMVHTSVKGGNGGGQSQQEGGGGGGVDGFDTFVFICILLMCAVLSSSTVLSHGWDDPTRNRFKLILHVIIIVTSVVPPELPMELSLAVTSAVADLIKRCGVFCTEPFRIPLAGTVDTCCFDKTGTITSDEMVLKGVRLPPSAMRGAGEDKNIECGDGSEAGGNDDLAMPQSAAAKDGNGGGEGEHDNEDGVGSVAAPKPEIPREVLRVMVACQSLASTGLLGGRGGSSSGGGVGDGSFLDGVVGDPLEKAVLRSCRWMLIGGDAVAPVPDPASIIGGGAVASALLMGMAGGATANNRPIAIWHRFAFTSKLKRMTVLATDAGHGMDEVWALSKGAPETLKAYLDPATIPDNYDAVSRRHMGMGQRVLAMAYRNLGRLPANAAGSSNPSHIRKVVKDRTKKGSTNSDGRSRTGGKSSKQPSWSRSHVEQNLTFAGFLILDCPLKPDSKQVITELRESGHECVMITGDAVLTAAEVARSVGIVGGGNGARASKKSKKKVTSKVKNMKTGGGGDTAETYELREMKSAAATGSSDDKPDGGRPLLNDTGGSAARFAFVPLDSDKNAESGAVESDKCIAYVPSNLPVVQDMLHRGEIGGICVGGDVITKIAAGAVRKSRLSTTSTNIASGTTKPTTAVDAMDDAEDESTLLLHPAARLSLTTLAPLISVFARHAPRQKEAVLAALNSSGRTTLMCGDGTNDVGALKMAHVGVSIVSVPELEGKQREAREGMERVKEEERKERKRSKRSKKKKVAAGGSGEGGTDDVAVKRKKRARKMTLEKHLRAMAEAEEELAYVNLGDASVASPFTARTMSIRCTSDILQRGRCTLVTMLQIYKILGVNCLVNALVLTKLHLAGAKQGDRQLTVVGVVIAALFLFVTRGKPLPALSSRRPPSSVLCSQALLSVALQFFVHFLAISSVTDLSLAYLDPHDPSLVPDGPFHANVLNTSTFLVTILATVNTFAVNYRGRPFMEDLGENTVLLRSVQVCYGVLFACAFEVFPPLNDLMQLSELPESLSASAGGGVLGGGGGGGGVVEAEMGALGGAMMSLLTQCVEAMGFKAVLCGIMALDSAAAFVVERVITRMFEGKMTSV